MLRLEIDRARWDAHLATVNADVPGLVPVAKGNGYGLGMERCVDEALKLGADTLAVGTFAEARRLPERAEGFSKVVVLTPHLPGDATDGLPIALFGRVVHTVATAEAARDLAGKRVIVECRTSLRRHGVGVDDLPALAEALADVHFDGFALHLPINRPRGAHPVAEVATWVARLATAGLPTSTIYVSHLTGPEVAGLGKQFPGTTFRARVGTKLWLGDRPALRPSAVTGTAIASARPRATGTCSWSRGERPTGSAWPPRSLSPGWSRASRSRVRARSRRSTGR